MLGYTGLCTSLLGSVLWGRISNPLLREPAFCDRKLWGALKDCKGSLQQLQMSLNNGSVQQVKALWSRHQEIYALQFCCVRLEPLERPPQREGIDFQVTDLGALEQSVGRFGLVFFFLFSQ